MIFKNKESAKSFANAYMYVIINDFNDPIKIEKKFIFIDVLKRALDLKIISLSDFMDDEDKVINKVYASNDEFIVKTLTKLRNNDIQVTEPRYSKKRHINPRYLDNDKIVTLIETDLEFKKLIENYLQ